jgi:hypothetical protein
MTYTRNALSDPSCSALQWADPFYAYVIATVDTLGYLCGITMKDLYLHPEACIEAFRSGKPKLHEMLGDDVHVIVPYTTPVIKYGHINSLGIPLLFPDTGQVALDMQPQEIPSIISFLEKSQAQDFATKGETPRYLAYLDEMRKAFPGERVHWGWQWEGPLTTAWALAGMNSMYGVYDDPEAFHRYLYLATASIVEYTRFYCKVDGTAVLDPFPDHGRLCDDIAAMFSPSMWPQAVLPYWEQFYTAPIPERKLHCEDMKPDHLPLLDSLNLKDYDPGISAHLNPTIIQARTKTPFCWRLGSFHYADLSLDGVENLVKDAAKAGARYVFTVMEPIMCEPQTIAKVRRFYHIGASHQRKPSNQT